MEVESVFVYKGANGKQAIIRAITMDLIVNQLKGKVCLACARTPCNILV